MMRAAISSVVALLAVSFPAGAQASALERLLMPGPVTEVHAPYESDCARCHEPLRKQAQSRLCMDCHEEVARDVSEGAGYHGHISAGTHGACRTCHTDHLGRDADITGLHPETFDHDASDFALTGGHSRVACASCHTAGTRFRDAPIACSGCHAEIDPHRGALGVDCASCHRTDSWRGAGFDHTRTGFDLRGAHESVSCDSCHPGERYMDASVECYDCHRLDDAHRGRRGRTCGDCHDAVRFDRPTFDHALDTTFPLRARHATIPCESCHTGTDVRAPVPIDCYGCHQADDVHGGQSGRLCETCHVESGWRTDVRFDHDTGAFPLSGMHAVTPCEQCHLTARYRDAPTACRDCHAREDAHEKRLGTDCAQCHNPNGWRLWRFDHDVETDFALEGAHIGLACEACHTKSVDGAPTLDASCNSCHRADDVHRGAYGPDCARCHSTTAFVPARMSR